MIWMSQILPGTGRGTDRRAVEGAHVTAAPPWAPSTIRLAAAGPPPRPGEDLESL